LTFGDPSRGNGNHQFEGYKPGIYAAHVCYWPRNLASLAFYALIKDDEGLSRRTAAAVYHYYKLREPSIDAQNDRGKDPKAEDGWPSDLWRGMHHIAGEAHLGIAYDLTARYMTEEQRILMRRVIAKATAGKRSYAANGPLRWRDTNWVGWDTQQLLCHLAIEGEVGYDPAVYAAERDTIRAYLNYGISRYGTIFETNGKNGAGLHFALTSAIALARRGDNYLGHPHLRRMSTSQVHQVVPAGGRNMNNGTYGCALFGNAGFLKNLYPQDRAADWLIQQGQTLDENDREFDLTTYEQQLQDRSINWRRLHPLTADTMFEVATFEGAADADGQGLPTWRRDYLNLPLDFEDPQHGQFCTRSSNDQDALYLMIEARPDLYCVGHQHHDAGHFYLSALGREWAVENDRGIRDSVLHNVVLIDGKGQGDTQHCAPAKARWLGATLSEHAAFAVMDLKHAYDYIWTTPMHYSWNHDERLRFRWEPEIDPEVVRIFRGTQRCKARIWMHSYWENNWGPTMRAPFNPVEYAYRTAGIVRGEHPYAIVVDDLRKDDAVHRYQWLVQVPEDLRMVDQSIGTPGEDKVLDLVLGEQDGDRRLLLRILAAGVAPADSRRLQTEAGLESFEKEDRGRVTACQRISLPLNSTIGHFKILFYPHRKGDPLPRTQLDHDQLHMQIGSQRDLFRFQSATDGRTRLSMTRNGSKRLDVP